MRGKTMEHAQKRKINFKGILTSSRTKRIALYALYFLAGLLGSRGMVFVRYAPFGAAAVAAVPIRSMWAVIAGSLVGYIWPSNAMHPIRYIAAIIAIAIIRCILNPFPSTVCAGSVFCSNVGDGNCYGIYQWGYC